jgi:hypothetical protein
MEKNKKLMKTVDKLTRQVDEAKSVIQALKAESVENKQLKVGIGGCLEDTPSFADDK